MENLQFEKIEEQMNDIKNNPDTQFFYTDETWIKNGKEIKKKEFQFKKSGRVFLDCLEQCFIGPSTALIKKTLLIDSGLFDESFNVCEDYELWLRLTLKNKVYLNPKELTLKLAGHEDQLSFKSFSLNYWRVKAIAKLVKTKNLNPEQKNKALSLLKDKCGVLKKGAIKHNNLKLLSDLDQITHSLI